MEKAFERLLFASRWLMAPMYLGLVAVLVSVSKGEFVASRVFGGYR